jgi:hypothetical protein
MSMVEVLKTKPVYFEVLDAIKEVIPQISRFNPSLNGPSELLWMKTQSQRLIIKN